MRRKDAEAHWVQVTHMQEPDQFICSHCRSVFLTSGNICPACGMQMRKQNSFASWETYLEDPPDLSKSE